MALSGRLWPIHLKPKDDELLSSWLVRLARIYGVKTHSFCSTIWPRKNIWNRDIDRLADIEVLSTLAEKTATPYERVYETTLRSFEGRLWETYNTIGNNAWLMPLGVYHREHRLWGLQYCSCCLAEDEDPYFRRMWRLAFVTVCEVHYFMLRDKCPECNSPLNYYRNQYWFDSITYCCKCGYDLRRAIPLKAKGIRQQVKHQKYFMAALKRGWINISGFGTVHSLLFFPVYHQFARLMATGKRKEVIQATMNQLISFPRISGHFWGRLKYVDNMFVEDRYSCIARANWLLEKWPNRFVRFCDENGILSSDLLRDMKNAPWWYFKTVYDYLYRPDYSPSDEEINQAIIYLKTNKESINKTSISKLFGVRNVFRKRKKKLGNYLVE
ncbi:MAG: TniQ family protein [Syntrophales bacterium]|jgi:hypothetical protein